MAEQSSNAQTPDEVASTSSELSQEKTETSGGWWDSFLSSAKAKSAEVYTMVKKDLDEIGSAVKSEATHVFSTTSNVIGKTLKFDEPESPANVMKKSFSSFIGQVSTALSPEPDDSDTEVILSTGDTTLASTYKLELEALQRVDATFLVPAEGPEFDAWLKSLDMEDESVISHTSAYKRLDASPILREQYAKLVPDAVTHDDFWERYLYRVALLQDRLAAASRKQPLERLPEDPVMAHLPMQTAVESPKAPSEAESAKAVLLPEELDNTTAWDDAEDFNNDIELTEEQQILLLEEYEKEISSKKHKQKDTINNNPSDPKSDNKSNKNRNRQNNKKSDICGNELVEDYFGEKDSKEKNANKTKSKDVIKDDASSNSDESWEKEFDNFDDAQTKS